MKDSFTGQTTGQEEYDSSWCFVMESLDALKSFQEVRVNHTNFGLGENE